MDFADMDIIDGQILEHPIQSLLLGFLFRVRLNMGNDFLFDEN